MPSIRVPSALRSFTGGNADVDTTATTVRVSDGKPQVESGTYLPECVGGFSVFEAENMEAAIALAARVPAARLGGAVEIRPAEKYW